MEEINRELTAWREVTSPFVEPHPSDLESRLPPASTNLAFGGERRSITTKLVPNTENVPESTLPVMSRIYHSQLERKLDSALTKVPASYVCNRCKGRGEDCSFRLIRVSLLTA